MTWAVEIVRELNTPESRGVFHLYQDGQIIKSWPCITGPATPKNPKSYGGATPPIFWEMIERIEMRTHPRFGTRMEMARIVPAYEEEQAEYSRRTFGINNVPFMVHVAGRSTGCPAILKNHWREAVRFINQAYDENDGYLMLHVVEASVVELAFADDEEENA